MSEIITLYTLLVLWKHRKKKKKKPWGSPSYVISCRHTESRQHWGLWKVQPREIEVHRDQNSSTVLQYHIFKMLPLFPYILQQFEWHLVILKKKKIHDKFNMVSAMVWFFWVIAIYFFALSGKFKVIEMSFFLCYRMSYVFCSNCQITIITLDTSLLVWSPYKIILSIGHF